MSENTLDLNEFMERVQEDKELLLELLDIFVDDYVKKRKLLQDAVDQSDYEQIRNIAHSLKGSSGNISAKDLRLIFMDVEEMGKISNVEGIDDKLTAMDKEYELLTVRIEEVKKEMS